MNEKYYRVAFYLTIISYQFSLLNEALDALGEYNPTMREVLALMKEIDHEIEVDGRKLLKRIKRGDNDAN